MIHQPDTPKTFSAVPSHPRLYRREGGTYYLRAKVPDALRPIVKKTEIRKSLGTKDYKTALELVKLKSLDVDRKFKQAREQLNGRQPEAPKLSREEIAWIVSDYFVKAESKAEDWTYKITRDSKEDMDALVDSLAIDAITLDSFPGNSAQYEGQDGAGYLDEYLQNEGDPWKIQSNSEAYEKLLRGIREATVENLNRTIDRLLGRDPQRRRFGNLTSHSNLPPRPRQLILLGKLLNDYEHYQKTTHAETTPSSYKVPIRILRETIGEETPLTSITRLHVEDACDVLRRVPLNMVQRYPGLSVDEAIKSASRNKDTRKIGERTLSNYYTLIIAIFNYALEYEWIAENPAKSRKLRELFKKKKRPVQRALFSSEELQKIFNAPLYTGCQDDGSGYKKRGKQILRRGRFWVPLIALFHGLRCNEACQLYVEDVQKDEGIWFFKLHEDLGDGEKSEKHLKNTSSWRNVPIHPEILKMGFLEYVNERKGDRSSKRLFPTLKLGENVERYSHVFSKWFGQFLISACGYRPKGTFHSFRHHWTTSLMNEGVPDGIVQLLGGWKSKTVGVEREYRHALMKNLQQAIGKVNYPGLVLTHLYAKDTGGEH